MENNYIKLIDKTEGNYKTAASRILEEYQENISNPILNRLNEQARAEELAYYKKEVVNSFSSLKEKFIKECREKLETTTYKEPEPTIVDSFTLRKKQLELLSTKDEDNIKNLKDIQNEQDFKIIKGLLIEQALEFKGDHTEIAKTKFTTQEDLKAQASVYLTNIEYNPNRIVGLNVGTNMTIRRTGLDRYLDSIANPQQQNNFR